MKRQLLSLAILIVLVFGLFSFSINFANSAARDGMVEVDLNVRGTFLLADPYEEDRPKNGSQVEGPNIIDLQSEGIGEGDVIYISYTGKVCIGAFWELDSEGDPIPPEPTDYKEVEKIEGVRVIAVFSESTELKPISELHRVTKALDAPDMQNYDTGIALFAQKSNDIPEDFMIESLGTLVQVPRLAKYLFLCLQDSYYPDNLGSVKVIIERDSDGDGLPDSWEKNGIYIDDDDKVDLDLPAMGARWDRKDIFVEIDYMGASGGHDHRPNIDALQDVIDAFNRAPVINPGPNGISLHVLEFIDEAIPHQDEITIWSDFDKIKKDHFGTPADRDPNNPNRDNVLEAKKMVFHYCLFIHNQKGIHYSGKAELPGNDFVISLGSFTGQTGNREEQAGTFMHELGHNLGLRHGGADDIQYKPNYLSVMNYLFQIPSSTSSLFSRPLTYSNMEMDPLNENDLNENRGVGIANWAVTVFSGNLQTSSGTSYVPIAASTLGAIDWNNNGDDSETDVAANINNFPQWDYPSPPGETLIGHNDWRNLVYRFRGHPNFADGVHQSASENELTFELAEAIEKELSSLAPPESPVPKDQNVDIVVKEGDWMEYSAAHTGNFPDSLSKRFSMQVDDIIETQIAISWEGENLDETKWSGSETFNVATGFHDLLIIPAGLDVGDQFYHEDFGNIVIQGAENYGYAGEERTVVWSVFSGNTMHWDQATGVLCQADWNWSSDYEARWTLDKTNLWGQEKIDPILIAGLGIAITAVLLIVFMLVFRRKKRNANKQHELA